MNRFNRWQASLCCQDGSTKLGWPVLIGFSSRLSILIFIWTIVSAKRKKSSINLIEQKEVSFKDEEILSYDGYHSFLSSSNVSKDWPPVLQYVCSLSLSWPAEGVYFLKNPDRRWMKVVDGQPLSFTKRYWSECTDKEAIQSNCRRFSVAGTYNDVVLANAKPASLCH